MINTCM